MKKVEPPRISLCPACHAGYGLNQGEMGHRTICQKCGQKFYLLPSSYDSPTLADVPPDLQKESWPLVGRLWLDLRPGQIIARRYMIERVLGRGGISQVFQVKDLSRNIELALKLPLATTLERLPPHIFIEEAVAWLTPASHPNMVTCDHVMVFMKQPVIFMEYVPGTDLWHLLEDGSGEIYWIEPRDAGIRLLDIFIQVARGLDYAHSLGLSHLDIKPRNILVHEDGRVLIGDYGPLSQPDILAKMNQKGQPRPKPASGEATNLPQSRLLGTPQYYSPEAAANIPGAGVSSDLWALALTALECFIGHRPWEVGSMAGRALEGYLADKSIKIPISASLAVHFRRALTENQALRQQNALEVEKELVAIYEEESGRPYERKRPVPLEETADRMNNKAISWMEVGQPDKAMELWQKILEREPEHKPSLHNKAMAEQWNNNHAPDLTRSVIPQWWLGRRLLPVSTNR